MLEEWIMAAILRNLPKHLTKELGMELKKVASIDDIHNIVNIYMYDHQIGMPRNMPGPMLCMAEKEPNGSKTEEQDANNKESGDKRHESPKTENTSQDNWDSHAAPKGGKGSKGIGKGKGYGECWHCGGWGHPRRECAKCLESKGSLGALKGGKIGKGKGKKGKGNKGYWAKGQGQGNKGGYNGGYYNSYRSPGKGIGKGFNYMDDDWFDAWGFENYYDYYSGDWHGQDVGQQFGYIGNIAMLLEKGVSGKKTNIKTSNGIDNDRISAKYRTGEHDPLRNTVKAKPITLHNKYSLLSDNESDDDMIMDNIDSTNNQDNTTRHDKTRQRRRQRPRTRHDTTRQPRQADAGHIDDEDTASLALTDSIGPCMAGSMG